ncbi:protein MODIFYING WALL LIGNIN-1 [Rhodamnia argentea]|uniref:Protein MODIFYING WALL LIGNIN-1 n=1 Tax=Rhodamnia argentea TaxID=178133 RepID=A0A8B8PZM3_9MYRT|nr:protein MODIFYING WALL LIGNIN-1 [Rhodamnia argentea]
MGNRRPGLAALLLSSVVVVVFAVAAALSCVAAEIKKTKVRQLKWDGKLCYLPRSHAFKYGVVALACLSAAQVVGYAAICSGFCSRDGKSFERRGGKRLTKAALFVVSWTSFGVAAAVLGAATSMSREQPYGRGWLDGECYLVRDGAFVASAVLAVIASGTTLCLAVMSMKKGRTEQDLKLHPQAG